ncbi:MAG TPA: polymer-forming cytoskeletal protein [Candidatus Binataceae bacterium]|jgi:cytoskeletal protein CcmA (bactofilin family)
MALFNKEPEKNVRPQSQLTPVTTSSAPVGASAQDRPAAPKASGAAPLGSEGRAYLDRGCRISGKLFFEGPTKIDGQVDGEIASTDALTIGETAVVTAQIKAASVVVAGKISGDIVATDRLEIRPSAKVLGNLTSPVLVVHEGAMFEGHCSMQPTGREERKVAVLPKEERIVVNGAPSVNLSPSTGSHKTA